MMKVGDIVKAGDGYAVVTRIDGDMIDLLFSDGMVEAGRVEPVEETGGDVSILLTCLLRAMIE